MENGMENGNGNGMGSAIATVESPLRSKVLFGLGEDDHGPSSLGRISA